MNVRAIQTSKITDDQQSLLDIVTAHITDLEEDSVLVVSSKIVALCEGRIADPNEDKQALVRSEADLYLRHSFGIFNYTFTINHRTLIGAAGIDTSNVEEGYVLWPADPQRSTQALWRQLREHYGLSQLGVIIIDSTSSVMRRGTIGIALGHCGFNPLTNYIGTHDIFGRELVMTQRNVAGSLAVAANVVMGEGSEQTPMAVISDIDFVEFQDRPPTQTELDEYYLTLDTDLYSPFFKNAPWESD